MYLPTHNGTVHIDTVSIRLTMFVYRGWGPRVSVMKLEYGFTLREETLSGTFKWPPMRRIPSFRKVGRSQEACEEECIRELGRTFGDRLKEYLRGPSPIYQHGQSSGHCMNVDSFCIVGKRFTQHY